MSHIIWLAAVPMAAFASWILAEVRSANRGIRISLGNLATVCVTFWVLSLAHSLGDYYRGMREYRLVQSLIRAYPTRAAELQKWSSAYDHYDASNHEKRMKELEGIVGER